MCSNQNGLFLRDQLSWEQISNVLEAFKRSVNLLARLIHLLSVTNTTTANVLTNPILSYREPNVELSNAVSQTAAITHAPSSDESVHLPRNIAETLLVIALKQYLERNRMGYIVSRDSLQKRKLIEDLIALLRRVAISDTIGNPCTRKISYTESVPTQDGDDDEDDGVNVIIRPIRHPIYPHTRSSTRGPDLKTPENSSITKQDKSTQTDDLFWRSAMKHHAADDLDQRNPSLVTSSSAEESNSTCNLYATYTHRFPTTTATRPTTGTILRRRWAWNNQRTRQPKHNRTGLGPRGRLAASYFTHPPSTRSPGDWNREHGQSLHYSCNHLPTSR